MQVMDPLKKKKELEEADEDLAVDSETSEPAHYANDKFAEAIDLTNHQANTKPDIDYEDQEQNVDLLPKAMETASPILETYPDPVEGDSDEEKIYHVARCSLACRALITFLLGVVKYYDSVTEFRECFGGATITELKSHQ